MAGDAQGNLYIVDSGSLTIKKLSPEGAVLAAWGSPEHLTSVRDLVIGADDNLYVMEDNGTIVEFSLDGVFHDVLTPIAGDPWANLNEAFVVDAAGQLFQVNRFLGRIQKFSRDGVLLLTWGPNNNRIPKELYPGGIALDPAGDVFVADASYGFIQRYRSEGSSRARAEWPEACAGEFLDMSDFQAGPDGAFYLVETKNGRVQKLDSAGRQLTAWGSRGEGPDEFHRPVAVAVGGNGIIYVLDSPDGSAGHQLIKVFQEP